MVFRRRFGAKRRRGASLRFGGKRRRTGVRRFGRAYSTRKRVGAPIRRYVRRAIIAGLGPLLISRSTGAIPDLSGSDGSVNTIAGSGYFCPSTTASSFARSIFLTDGIPWTDPTTAAGIANVRQSNRIFLETVNLEGTLHHIPFTPAVNYTTFVKMFYIMGNERSSEGAACGDIGSSLFGVDGTLSQNAESSAKWFYEKPIRVRRPIWKLLKTKTFSVRIRAKNYATTNNAPPLANTSVETYTGGDGASCIHFRFPVTIKKVIDFPNRAYAQNLLTPRNPVVIVFQCYTLTGTGRLTGNDVPTARFADCELTIRWREMNNAV